mgnify:FL=1
MKNILKMYHFKNSELYDALNSGESDKVRTEVERTYQNLQNGDIQDNSLFVRAFQNSLETEQERIIFAMGRLAGYLSPYEMAQRESIYIKVFNAGVDLVDFEKLVSAFIKYTPMTVDQLAKTIHKPFEETKSIVQKLTDAGIIYTPEVKIGQDTYYLLKNGACYVNIEEQMKYTPEVTVQENSTSKDTGVDFFEER